MSNNQFQNHRTASESIRKLFDTPNTVVFIHYSCESFYDIQDGRSPRITSIAIRYLGSGQTKSFSIHQEAELDGLSLSNLASEYDRLEKGMLEKFYARVSQLEGYTWVHWNMRDANYGFEAIAHRYRVLEGLPEDIPDNSKIDLARVLHDLMGPKYEEHPRLENILIRNKMVPRNFLGGKEEAEAFSKEEYVKLHQSTLCKVDAIMNLAESARDDRLECANNYFIRKGFSVSTAGTILKDHPFVTLLGLVSIIIAIAANIFRLSG